MDGPRVAVRSSFSHQTAECAGHVLQESKFGTRVAEHRHAHPPTSGARSRISTLALGSLYGAWDGTTHPVG
jgi:hypothetical protein